MAKLRLVKGRRPRYTLVYAMRLFREGTIDHAQGIAVARKDGTAASVTPHVIEGTVPQIRRQLARSVDAFFELHEELIDESR